MLSSILSPDSMLATLGAAEEDRAVLRQIWQTLSNATLGVARQIYTEYRALTPEQRTTIRQNIVNGVNHMAEELSATFNRNDIRAGLALLAQPTTRTITHHEQLRIEELPDEDVLRPRPTVVPTITYSTPTPRIVHSATNSQLRNFDTALAEALNRSMESTRTSQLTDPLLQQALEQSAAEAYDADLAEALRQSAAAHQATLTQANDEEEDDERPVILVSKRTQTPKKSKKKTISPVSSDSNEDDAFQAIAASLEERPKAITPNLKRTQVTTSAPKEEKNKKGKKLDSQKKPKHK